VQRRGFEPAAGSKQMPRAGIYSEHGMKWNS
jgi:hypothetical protein